MSRPIASRFEITVLKDKGSGDKSQVIASDASIQFYRQGAAVKSSVTLSAHATVVVDVFDAGQIAFADTLRVESTTNQLSVMDVPNKTQVELYNGNLVSVGLIAGTRLTPINDPALVYADPLATVSLGSTLAVDSGTGRASAYLANDRVDYVVSIPGQSTRLYIDGAGVLGRSDQRWSDLRDYGGDLQAAVDGLSANGGIVFVPRGEWPIAAGVTIDKPNVTIMGETSCSRLKVAEGHIDHFDLITVRAERFQLRDIDLDAAAADYNASGHSCLVLAGSVSDGISVRGASIWKVSILGAPRYGLWLKDCEDFHAHQCFVVFSKGVGVRIESSSSRASKNICFVGGGMAQNQRQGVEATGVEGLLLVGCVIEGNRLVAGEAEGAGVDVRDSTRVAMRSCYFEDADNPTTSNTSQFVYLHSCPRPSWMPAGFRGAMTLQSSLCGPSSCPSLLVRSWPTSPVRGSRIS